MICPNCRSEIGNQPVCPNCGTVQPRAEVGYEHFSSKTVPITQPYGFPTTELNPGAPGSVYYQRLTAIELRSKLSLVLASGSFVLQMIILVLLLYR